MAISKTQSFLERIWYNKPSWWLWLFYPIHLLLSLLVIIRRKLYQLKFLSSKKIDVPVVVIGNITVGGTGKTPLSIYLLKKLSKQGISVGLVTRGYGGQSDEYPLIVSKDSKVTEVGDEPKIIYNNTQAPIAVDPNRARGAQFLADKYQCDLIVCDDGLQHYALQRDLEILVVDSARQFGNEFLMPFGPLREPVGRAENLITVVNGQNMKLRPQSIRGISNKTSSHKSISSLQQPITAVAAIGNPQRFFNTLSELGVTYKPKVYPDHYTFTEDDFSSIEGAIIMTEKDAVKCEGFSDERFYYLPVEAELDDSLGDEILNAIKQLVNNHKDNQYDQS